MHRELQQIRTELCVEDGRSLSPMDRAPSRSTNHQVVRETRGLGPGSVLSKRASTTTPALSDLARARMSSPHRSIASLRTEAASLPVSPSDRASCSASAAPQQRLAGGDDRFGPHATLRQLAAQYSSERLGEPGSRGDACCATPPTIRASRSRHEARQQRCTERRRPISRSGAGEFLTFLDQSGRAQP